MADIIYTLEGGTYMNITNKCPCRCTFCIRSLGDAVGDAENLWFYGKEPTIDEIKNAIDNYDFSKVDSVVFCGYGEPTERLDDLIETADYLRSIKPDIKLRLNTNGLSDLLHGRGTAPELSGLVDAISISLNAASAEKYDRLCHPKFGLEAWPAILRFTEEVKQYVPDVTMSVVGGTIPEEDVEVCRQIAQTKLGVKFRVR